MSQLLPTDGHQEDRHYADANNRVDTASPDTRDQIAAVVADATATVRENPYTTLAIVAGLAFAVGALWKLTPRSPQSQLQHLMARLPDVVSSKRLRSYWN